MTLREVCKIEIWSAQTSRRILKVLGITIATVFVVGTIVAGIELYWVSPPEREAAKVALREIEILQQMGSTGDGEYKMRKDRAEAAVEKADGAAWTARDREISMALLSYLSLTTIQHDEPRVEASILKFQEQHPERPLLETNQQRDQVNDLLRQVAEEVSKTLHGALK